MRPRIALAASRSFLSLGPDGPLLLPALAAAGFDAEPVAWDADVEWGSYDAVVVRATWDYCERLAEFLAWVDRVGAVTRLANAPGVLRWNSDKRYLRDVAAAGIPVVPTRWIGPGDPVDLPDGLDDYVVKPAVSAGARDTGRFGRADGEAARALARRLQGEGRWTMVQPYVRRVDADGETSVFVFAGEPSHAVRKGAVLERGAGVRADFALAHAQSLERMVASLDERSLASRALAVVPGGARDLLYARVDMVRDDDGVPTVLELELIEPALFLPVAPDGAARFARALGVWLERANRP